MASPTEHQILLYPRLRLLALGFYGNSTLVANTVMLVTMRRRVRLLVTKNSAMRANNVLAITCVTLSLLGQACLREQN